MGRRGLMRTRVVLKLFSNPLIRSLAMFNENKSCIEICRKELHDISPFSLMRTRVVLKFLYTLCYIIYVQFNENKSCIEIQGVEEGKQQGLSLMRTRVVLKSILSFKHEKYNSSLMRIEVV